jgi:hypothetical protein
MGVLFAHRAVVSADGQKVREAAVAGSFYPADPAALTAMMDQMMANVELPAIDGPIVAAVAPHAGYPYSGPVAAYTYAALKGRHYSRVVVIAPSHYEAFGFTSVYDGDAYQTPLGTVPVDKEFAAKLKKASGMIELSERGHTPTSAGGEHALEVQLPWLQHVLGNFTLVPVVMGDQSYDASRSLGLALARLIGTDQSTLIVASSDLSHYHTYDQAVTEDHKTLDALQSWDYYNMSRNFQQGVWEACGGAPIVAAMVAAERLGANRAMLLRYANSGDVTGDKTRVVGYGSAVFVKAQKHHAEEEKFSLTDAEKARLLALARNSVEHAVRERKAWDPGTFAEAALNRDSGAFVTLKEGGELRGCIGYTDPIKPLYQTVRDTATLAAFQDPRFSPVTADELPKLEYEVSVLSPLRRVRNVEEIRVGEHGLLVRRGEREGLLLPQVASEQHWDRQKFLEQTCVKAGMPPNCWQDEDTDIFCFTAIVFGEKK